MDPRQTQHAVEQKMLRTVMDENGVTRSQARKVFQQAIIADRLADRARDQVALRQQEARTPPVIRRQEIEVKPPMVRPAVPGAPGAAGANGAADLELTNCVIVKDGVLYTADIYLDPDSLTVV